MKARRLPDDRQSQYDQRHRVPSQRNQIGHGGVRWCRTHRDPESGKELLTLHGGEADCTDIHWDREGMILFTWEPLSALGRVKPNQIVARVAEQTPDIGSENSLENV